MACIVSLLMLITLSAQRAHQFVPHYRMAQVRRTAERHSVAAHSNVNPTDKADQVLATRAFSDLVEPKESIEPLVEMDPVTRVRIPIPRLLSRLKLGPPSSDSLDPLI